MMEIPKAMLGILALLILLAIAAAVVATISVYQVIKDLTQPDCGGTPARPAEGEALIEE